MWDVFLSHASDDKPFARSLAAALEERGAKVWFDEVALVPGDSLTERIDDGLGRCRVGVVLLSRSFFERAWTREELRGLRTRHLAGEQVLVPVWHGIGAAEVRAFSPPLADLVGVSTELGVEQVARRVMASLNGTTAEADLDPSLDLRLQAHLAQVRDLAPARLLGRERELARLAAFCVGKDRYLHLVADAWAGKTALAASFALSPPEDVAVVSFFVSAGLSGQSDSSGFTDSLISQLAPLAGEASRLPPGASWSERDGERRRLLERAAARTEERGRHLLLLVDGLDEDRGADSALGLPSIASLLPTGRLPALRTLLTSRPHPELPLDVGGHHPLRTEARRVVLSASPHAADVATLAKRELLRQLREPGVEARLIGLLCAAEDGLTLGELAELTGNPRYLLTAKVESSLGRSLTARPAPGRSEPALVLAHEALREEATALLADRLPEHRLELASWAERYAKAGWPEQTPYYLLWGYGKQLSAARDGERLLALAADPQRARRMAAEVGGAAVAVEEVRAAERQVRTADQLDLGALARLAVQREKLLSHARTLPRRLPSLLSRLGEVETALQVSQTMHNEFGLDASLGSLVEELCEEGRLTEAEQVASKVSRYRHGRAYSTLARAWIEAGERQRAEALYKHIGTREKGPLAVAFAESGWWEASIDLAESLNSKEGEQTLDRIGQLLEGASPARTAARLAADHPNPTLRRYGLLWLAEDSLERDPAEAAELARSAIAADAEEVIPRSVVRAGALAVLWRAGCGEEARRLAFEGSDEVAARRVAELIATDEGPRAARFWLLGLPDEKARLVALTRLIGSLPKAEAVLVADDVDALLLLDSLEHQVCERGRVSLAAALAPIDLDRALQTLDWTEPEEEGTGDDHQLAEASRLLDAAKSDQPRSSNEGLRASLVQSAHEALRRRGWRVPSRTGSDDSDADRARPARAAEAILLASSPSKRATDLLNQLAQVHVELEQWDELATVLGRLETDRARTGPRGYGTFADAHRAPAEIIATAKRLWAETRMDEAAALEDMGDLLETCCREGDWELKNLALVCSGRWEAAEAAAEDRKNFDRHRIVSRLIDWSAMAGRWEEAERLARRFPDSPNITESMCAICRAATLVGEHRRAESLASSLEGLAAARVWASIATAAADRGEDARAEAAVSEIDDAYEQAETLAAMAAATDSESTRSWRDRAYCLAEQLPGDAWAAQLVVSMLDSVPAVERSDTIDRAVRLCRKIDDRKVRREALAPLVLPVAREDSERALPLLLEVRDLVGGERLGWWEDRCTVALFKSLAKAREMPAEEGPDAPSAGVRALAEKEAAAPVPVWSPSSDSGDPQPTRMRRTPLTVVVALARAGRDEELVDRAAHLQDPAQELAEAFAADETCVRESLLSLAEKTLPQTPSATTLHKKACEFIDALLRWERWEEAQRIADAANAMDRGNEALVHLFRRRVTAGRLDEALATLPGPGYCDRGLLAALIEAGRSGEAQELADRTGEHRHLAIVLADAQRFSEAEATTTSIADPAERSETLTEIAWRVAHRSPADARRLAKQAIETGRWVEPPDAMEKLAIAIAGLRPRLAGELAVAAVEAGRKGGGNLKEICRLVYSHGRPDLTADLLLTRFNGWYSSGLAGLVEAEKTAPYRESEGAHERIVAVLAQVPDDVRWPMSAEIAVPLLHTPGLAKTARLLIEEAAEGAAGLKPLQGARLLLTCAQALSEVDGAASEALQGRAISAAEKLPADRDRAKLVAAAVRLGVERGGDLDPDQAAGHLTPLIGAYVYGELAMSALSRGDPRGTALAANCIHRCRDLGSTEARSALLTSVAQALAATDPLRAVKTAEAALWQDEDWSPLSSTAFALGLAGHFADSAALLNSIPGDMSYLDAVEARAAALRRLGRWEDAHEAIADLNSADRPKAYLELGRALAEAELWIDAAQALAEIPKPSPEERLLIVKVAMHAADSESKRAEKEAEGRIAVADVLGTSNWTSAFDLLAELDPAATIDLAQGFREEAKDPVGS